MRSVIALFLVMVATALGGAAWLQGPPKPTGGQVPLKMYRNDRFGFTVLYPGYMKPQTAPANGDGRKFFGYDGDAKVIVWGSYLNEGIDLRWHYSQALKQLKKVDSKSFKGEEFQVSGTRGDWIVHQRTILKKGVFTSVLIEYKKDRKTEFDRHVKPILSSLSPG